MNHNKVIEKLDKPVKFLGLAALVFFLPQIGYLFGAVITIESQIEQIQDQTFVLPSTIPDAHADQSVEGFKYIIEMNDGIGTKDLIK